MEIDALRRVIESSPIIVIVLGLACWALWRKLDAKDARLDAKDAMLLSLQRETLGAMSSVTTAVSDLREALNRRA